MSVFKDDLEAAHARIRALERELASLRGTTTEPHCLGEPSRRADRAGWLLGLLCAGAVLSTMVIGVLRRPLLLPGLGGLALLVVVVVLLRRRLVARPCEALVLVPLTGSQPATSPVVPPGTAAFRPGAVTVARLPLRPVAVPFRAGDLSGVAVVAAPLPREGARFARAVASLVGASPEAIAGTARPLIEAALGDCDRASSEAEVGATIDEALDEAGLTLLSWCGGVAEGEVPR